MHLFLTAMLQGGMTIDISKSKHFHWIECKRNNVLIWTFGKVTGIIAQLNVNQFYRARYFTYEGFGVYTCAKVVSNPMLKTNA